MPSLRRSRLCGAPLRAAPRPGHVVRKEQKAQIDEFDVSRAQRSTKWCAADPGSLQTLAFAKVPDLRCIATRCTASGTKARDGNRNAFSRRPCVRALLTTTRKKITPSKMREAKRRK